MNYENFYQELLPHQKSLKDSLALLQKLFKTTGKEVESGDMKSLIRDLNAICP